ncbi:MBL fold metallo-hydrolase [Lentibacillus salicampi]|uniref:MBL fold metallo-hydrolase n=1 Tax=Lentibacillus salicampi TaxID=175306 RepID=A0A4Y9ACJ0_9BACI|nr:MBL fold metallo-hydrolase [Lentibacillus salicampi]TFJ92091.1 MBL fold metallo-hydrolase [Lentibacillus salicampi]
MGNIGIIQQLKQANLYSGKVILQFIGQAGMIIQGKQDTLVIDPYLSDYAEKNYGLERTYQPFYKPDDLKGVDYYMITHDHADHLDPGTVSICAEMSPETIFIAPSYCHQLLLDCNVKAKNIWDIKDETWQSIGELAFRAIPSAHEDLEKIPDGGYRFLGYIGTLNGVTFYHAGDTVVYSGLLDYLKEQPIDIAMLPINGRNAFRFERGAVGNMNYQEAAELSYQANFELTIPVHYDMFADNTERPGHFVDLMYENFSSQKFHMMAREEQMIYTNMQFMKSD